MTSSRRLGWKRNLIAGACFALAFGAFACTGRIGGIGSTTGGNGTGPGVGTGGTGPNGGSGTGGSGPATGGTGLNGGSGTGGSGPGQPDSPNSPNSLTLDAGRTVLRRLNRTEYNLTIRDLLGTSSSPGDALPADETEDGFDTVGESLAISPVHAETMEAAASALADELFALPSTDAKRTKVFVCAMTTGAEATCARQILTTFARRAFRRPAATAEIDSLMSLVDKVRVGATYSDGLKAGIIAILLSPHFVYREENSVGVGANGAAKSLNAFELATRLSYFLWSTMPDAALADAADTGKLTSDPAELPAQIERMLSDPKATALTTGFATEWLTINKLSTNAVDPNPKIYPPTVYDAQLKDAAAQETAMFFSKLISDNLPLSTLIDADFTYANARLAKLYGVTATGTALTRVSLAGTPRAGVLTQASFLMVNAHPDRSGPVQRGDWILNRILCAPTPPPPDNIVIPEFPDASVAISGRAFLEQHRADLTCAACHQFIDPLGLGLENYDAIGAYRTMDSGSPVDSSGVYPGGTAFSSAAELSKLIAKDPRYPACVTKQLLTYAAGRSFSASDSMAYVQALAARATSGGAGQWRSLISMVASSDAFRTNRPEAQ